MTNPSDSNSQSGSVPRKQKKTPGAKKQMERRSEKNRRHGWGTLIYYLSGGSEHRSGNDRRKPDSNGGDSVHFVHEKRGNEARRQKKMHVNSLYPSNIIDRRDGARRKKNDGAT